MRKPKQRGAPINMRRVRDWVQRFSGYRITVTENRIDRWLHQFADADRDVAARTLDSVEFLGSEQIADAYRSLLSQVPGWHRSASKRTGNWRFVAFSGSAGESGDEMLRRLRNAGGMAPASWNGLFIHRSELLRERLESDDTVVFVDDLSGTGTQAVNGWNEFAELLPGKPEVYLLLVAATEQALARIRAETPMIPLTHWTFGAKANVFHSSCKHFSGAEKDTLLQYCVKADKKQPRGFGDCGLTLVFSHACPSNSIPILHAASRRWEGLFRRHDG